MNRIKAMMTSEAAIGVILTVLAITNVTRPPNTPTVQAPIQIVLIGKATSPAVRATIYSADWCAPCKTYIGGTKEHPDGVKDLMPPDGWIVREDGDKDAALAHVIVTKSTNDWKRENITTIPCTIIRKNGKEVKRFVGKLTPERLADAINEEAKKE